MIETKATLEEESMEPANNFDEDDVVDHVGAKQKEAVLLE
jgi:hypothetical protein